MSLLADWYFCTAMRLSPADTHAFLDTLGVLRRTDAERADLLDAAEALKSSPSWLQLYALRPLLTAHGRLADRTAATADGAPGPEGPRSPRSGGNGPPNASRRAGPSRGTATPSWDGASASCARQCSPRRIIRWPPTWARF